MCKAEHSDELAQRTQVKHLINAIRSRTAESMELIRYCCIKSRSVPVYYDAFFSGFIRSMVVDAERKALVFDLRESEKSWSFPYQLHM